MTGKRDLRVDLRARRRTVSGSIPAWSPFVAILSPGLVVASYMPMGGEADPVALEQAARDAGCRIALPRVVDRATPLVFLASGENAVLVDGPFGLRQPPDHHPPLVPDIVLTPLVGFDRAGNRLGQGAGHYDRAFRRRHL